MTYKGAPVQSINLVFNFVLDIAAFTADEDTSTWPLMGGLSGHQWREATANWTWNGSGSVVGGVYQRGQGAGVTAPSTWDTSIGSPTAIDITGPLANDMGRTQKWI